MPGKDGTGPIGAGAMTGRGLGICSGNYTKGFSLNRGYGCFRGLNVRNFSNVSDKEALKEQKALLQARIEAIDNLLNN